MPDFYGFCVALLAAVGIICLVWALVGFILRPRRAFPVTVVVRARTAGELTSAIQRCDWTRCWKNGDFALLIVSDDLEPEARLMAAMYEESEAGALVCRMEELEELILSSGVGRESLRIVNPE